MEAEAEAAKGHNVEIATVYQHHWHPALHYLLE